MVRPQLHAAVGPASMLSHALLATVIDGISLANAVRPGAQEERPAWPKVPITGFPMAGDPAVFDLFASRLESLLRPPFRSDPPDSEWTASQMSP